MVYVSHRQGHINRWQCVLSTFVGIMHVRPCSVFTVRIRFVPGQKPYRITIPHVSAQFLCQSTAASYTRSWKWNILLRIAFRDVQLQNRNSSEINKRKYCNFPKIAASTNRFRCEQFVVLRRYCSHVYPRGIV